MAPETNMDRLGRIAYELSEKVREHDPVRVRSELIGLCAQHPVKAAQLLMVLSIWFDPETTTEQLWGRVDSVARSRITGRL